jgi:Ras GTPase-activating-like protein IQGAP2/3
MGPKIRDLRGQLSFTEEELRAEKAKMDEAGLPMPNFGSVESSLAKEMKEEESG